MRFRDRAGRMFDNWPIKVLCIGAAVLLFVFHHLTSLSERFFTIPLQLRQNSSLAPASEYPQRIRVSLKGDEDRVFSILEEDISAYVDLGREAGEGVYRFPIMIRKKGSAQDADALEIRIDPDTITLTLERRMSKSLKVVPVIRTQPQIGFNLDRLLLNPPAVTAEGPRSRIQKLSVINTEEIDLGGKQENFAARVRLARPDQFVQVNGSDSVEFRAEISQAVQSGAEMSPPEAGGP